MKTLTDFIATLADLEPILYLFAVTECPQSLGVPNDVHTLICNIETANLYDKARPVLRGKN